MGSVWNQNIINFRLFFNKCGKQTPKKVKTIKGNKTFKWTKKNLKKSKGSCKIYVIAVNGASKAITVTVK